MPVLTLILAHVTSKVLAVDLTIFSNYKTNMR